MFIPEGYATITPYFFVTGAEAFADFLVGALGAIEVGRNLRPDGKIANGQFRIGTNTLMLSEATADYPPMPASIYLFVEDADATITRALEHGASLEMAARDMPYQDRQGGVRDAFGNVWWITQRLIDAPYS